MFKLFFFNYKGLLQQNHIVWLLFVARLTSQKRASVS